MSSGIPAAPAPGPTPEGLRERKKRLMRQQLSDTATGLFLERGFDGVRVSEVAAACGVSEKTVFNYFPAKEALVLDRLETILASLRAGLADPSSSALTVVLGILDHDLGAITGWLDAQDDRVGATAELRRFGDLIRATPSLRAYQADMIDRSVAVVAEQLGARMGMAPDDPEPLIAARALLGLWHVQAESLRRHLGGSIPPARLRAKVAGDVQRAAGLIDHGLRSHEASASVRGPRSKRQRARSTHQPSR